MQANKVPALIHSSGNDQNLPSTDFRESIPEIFEEEIHLRDYIEVIVRRKWLVLGLLFFTFISTLIFTLASEKLYLGTGSIEASQESQRVTKFEDVSSEKLRFDEFVNTQVSLLKSNALANRVINELNLAEHPVLNKSQEEDSSFSFITKLKTWLTSLFKKENSETDYPVAMSLEEALKDKNYYLFSRRIFQSRPKGTPR